MIEKMPKSNFYARQYGLLIGAIDNAVKLLEDKQIEEAKELLAFVRQRDEDAYRELAYSEEGRRKLLSDLDLEDDYLE